DLQEYHTLEAAGVNLWHRNQQSTRWAVFRNSSHSHNTLVVNGELQRVSGFASFVRSVGEGPMPHSIIDMSTVYEGQLASALRGVALLGKAVVIQADWQAAADATEVRWAMMTRAEVEIVEPHRAILRQDGQTLELRVLSPADA